MMRAGAPLVRRVVQAGRGSVAPSTAAAAVSASWSPQQLVHSSVSGAWHTGAATATATAQYTPLSVRTLTTYNNNNLPANTGVRVVPEQSAWIVERFGRFHTVLKPGLHFLIPFVDKIAYVHSLKETAITIPNQTAITRDNVTIQIDGVLYVKVMNPRDASYGVSEPIYAVTQLAQTTMRSELGKMSLDRTFEERESLNSAIVETINQAAESWGIHCLRYEIRDITPPVSVKAAMDMQAEAERKKRAEILESEGNREATINTARGRRESILLKAQGDAAGIVARAKATASGIRTVARSIHKKGGANAVSLRVAEQYVDAFGKIAKKGNTVVLPANVGDPASMVAQAMAVFKTIGGTTGTPSNEDNSDDEEYSDEEDDNEWIDAAGHGDQEDGSHYGSHATDDHFGFRPVPLETVTGPSSRVGGGGGGQSGPSDEFHPKSF